MYEIKLIGSAETLIEINQWITNVHHALVRICIVPVTAAEAVLRSLDRTYSRAISGCFWRLWALTPPMLMSTLRIPMMSAGHSD